MAFSYFVAICKHYPYRKIEEYANYRTYNFAFRQLFRPFIRRALRYFMSNLFMKKGGIPGFNVDEIVQI